MALHTVHATCVAWPARGAVLITGPSGSGKSDLALRLIHSGAKLIADDRVTLTTRGQDVFAEAPEAARGVIEVYGHGIVRLQPELTMLSSVVLLVAELAPPGTVPTRMPELQTRTVAGQGKPCLICDAAWPGTPAKIHALIFAQKGGHLVQSL